MKKILLSGIVGLLVVLAPAATAQAGPYALLSSGKSQLAAPTPTLITLDQEDALKGFKNANGVITFEQAGTYFVMAAGQVGSTKPTGQGTVRLWLRKNRKDIPNSNAELTILPGFTTVLVSQGVAQVNAGDTMELMMSVSKAGQGLGMLASTPKGESAVPSMIFSAFKVVGDTYAQLSSGATQTPGAKGNLITLEQNDAVKQIGNNNGVVTIEKAGIYFVMASGQVGNTKQNGKGAVRLWLRRNGIDVKNSNTEQSIDGKFTAVQVCQAVMECKPGDKVELLQSASNPGLGMIASTPKGEPAVPSMILSIVKVDGSAYAQLSSSNTQIAKAAPQEVTLNQVDAAKKIANKNGAITVKEAGVYFVMAAGQIGDEGKHDASALNGALKDVINAGAKVYNDNGDHAGCYRMYQGSLLSVRPFLAPDLQKKIDAGVAKAETLGSFADRAHELRGVLDEIRDRTKAPASKGTVRFWMRQNGTDIPNSNSEQSVGNKYTAVLVCQGVGEVKAGDTLQLVQSSRGEAAGLIASRPQGEPVVPSMIFSLLKVD
jgi:hypothetical protein